MFVAILYWGVHFFMPKIEGVSKLDDEKLQMILIYRYIDWMTWYEIAKKVSWSISSVKRKHEEALRELKM